ncbi:MAG: inositol monophosphatase family protein [Steroidobacteraceae bacterium]
MQHPMLNIGIRAARKAGDVIVRSMSRLHQLEVRSKDRNDFFTEVDLRAEVEIIDIIRSAFPDHGILAEESGRNDSKNGAKNSNGDDEFIWIIDPLDGTTNFIHGFPHFAVSIGLQRRGRMECAIIFDPVKQELFTAAQGDGAKLDDRRIRVSKQLGLEGALIGTGFPYRANLQWLDAYMGMFKDLTQQAAGLRRPGSAALDLAYVAAGRLDGFWELGLAPWDTAAGMLLITEAGGLVSTLRGGEYQHEGHIVAGNPKIHAALLESIAPHLPSELR